MKIFLIGMPGSGKSTFGKLLADKLFLPFVDLDKEIEKSEEKTIEEIFAEKGESYFRQVEADQLRLVCSQQHSFLLATGGGAPCFHNSLSYMKEAGKTIFLDVAVETLFERIQSSTNRPLLQLQTDKELIDRLKEMREERLPVYQQADFVFSESTLSLEKVVDAVVKTGSQQ